MGSEAGSTSLLTFQDEVLGLALRTRTNVNPVYLSIGHRVDLECMVQIIPTCGRGCRLPEPARQAYILAKASRNTPAAE